MNTNSIPLFSLSNDPLRGVGLEGLYDNFHIICIDHTDVVDWLIESGANVYCIEKETGTRNGMFRNTRKLLLDPSVQQYILDNSTDEVGILFFKPQFDPALVLSGTKLGTTRTIRSLNPSHEVSDRLENKKYFSELCKSLGIHQPKHEWVTIDSLDYSAIVSTYATPFVLQLERGWFGNSTYKIESEDQFNTWQEDNRKESSLVKVAEYVVGRVLTNNAVVSSQFVYQSLPFLQLNDDGTTPRLARMWGSTIGNVWGDECTNGLEQPDSVIRTIQEMTMAIGTAIRKSGYNGFYGLDFIITDSSDVYVQEMNPRFTASTQMITRLERSSVGISLFDLHMIAFGITLPHIDSSSIMNPDIISTQLVGSRVVARNTTNAPVTIDKWYKNGIYSYHAGELQFVRGGYGIEALESGEVLLLTVGEGRVVNPDQEILQVQSKLLKYNETIALAKQLVEVTEGI